MLDELGTQIVNELMEELESNKLVLPSLPEVALKVRDTIEDDNATSGDLAKSSPPTRRLQRD